MPTRYRIRWDRIAWAIVVGLIGAALISWAWFL